MICGRCCPSTGSRLLRNASFLLVTIATSQWSPLRYRPSIPQTEAPGQTLTYNPGKQGRRSFHPLLAVVAKIRLCPVYRFRSGDTVSASQWHEAMADAERWLGDRRVELNRGDLGFGHDAIMSWHETAPGRPKFLFKLKLTNPVRSALHRIKESDWQGPAILGACQMAEGRIQLTGWKTSRRVIFARTLQGVVPAAHRAEFWDQHKHEFAVYVTNLPDEVNGWQIQELYRQRADTENVFDELKKVGLQRLLREVQSDDRTGGAAAARRLQPMDALCPLHRAAETYRGQTRSTLVSIDRRQTRAIGSAKRTASLYQRWLG